MWILCVGRYEIHIFVGDKSFNRLKSKKFEMLIWTVAIIRAVIICKNEVEFNTKLLYFVGDITFSSFK